MLTRPGAAARRHSASGARWLALLTLAGLLLVPTVASAQDPPSGVRDRGLGIALVGGPPDVASRFAVGRAIYDALEPGVPRTWKLLVENDTPEPMTVDLFVADVVLGDAGMVIDDLPSSGPVADWVTMRPTQVTLAPRAHAEVLVDLLADEDAVGGEVLAAIVAQPPVGEGGLRAVRRVAVPVFLGIGEQYALADFSIDSMVAGRDDQGRPYVDVQATNTGERTISLAGQMTLADGPGGLSVDPVASSNTPSVPVGGTGVVRFVFEPGLPDGPWTARAELSGGNALRAATAQILFPSAAGQQAPSELATPSAIELQRGVLIPVNIVLLVLCLGGLLLWWFVGRRRDDEEPDDAREAVEILENAGRAP